MGNLGGGCKIMRYLVSARVRPGRRADLLAALEEGRFSEGFPYGDLGEVLAEGRVDLDGTIRWVEVCYCREYLGAALVMELPYLVKFLTDIEIADARSPRHCKGYPECDDCDCTRKVSFAGEPVLEHLRAAVESTDPPRSGPGWPTRWLGWQGEVCPEEARRNRAGEKSRA
jgi:hypothetical protein